MANNNLSGNENILVKIDQNNLIYIDPNSVIDSTGKIVPRGIEQEKLVTYVNLEADIIPRTILAANNDKITYTSIAKGTLNFLKNQDGRDYDTTWTNSYGETTLNSVSGNISGNFSKPDTSGQSLGISSISILIKGANFVPQVNINFIDVRGKTLFEAPDDSPYNAFFHLPWPIFYLTVKGYYGQAIRYRLHLVKFSSKFNEANGNFEITTNFVGSTYAFMNDIPLKGVLNAPYMYSYDNQTPSTKQYNAQSQTYNVTVNKLSRGYELLTSVYAEYKLMGLLDPNFPVKTLKELGETAKILDKILEREIFSGKNSGIDPKILQAMKQLGEAVETYQRDITTWKNRYSKNQTFTNNNIVYNYLVGNGEDATTLKNIIGTSSNTLENIILINNKKIQDVNDLINFVKNKNKDLPVVNIQTISFDKTLYSSKEGLVGVAISYILNLVNDIANKYNQEKQNIDNFLEKRINTVLKDPKLGIGFEPTIRNIFAVICANADVYIRLLKETHQKAFDAGPNRKNMVNQFSIETKNNNNIYPWPEIRKRTDKGKQQVIAYPGEAELISKLQSDKASIWPEVQFLENYYKIVTLSVDPNGTKEATASNVNFIFPNNLPTKNVRSVSTSSNLFYNIPYYNQTPSSFIYEIWERCYFFSLFDSFNSETINELAQVEFDNNIKNIINNGYNDNSELISLLKTITVPMPTGNVQLFTVIQNMLSQLSPFQGMSYYNDQLPTTPYLINVMNNPFKTEQYINITDTNNNDSSYTKTSQFLNSYQNEPYRNDIYPFSSSLYKQYVEKYNLNIKGLFNIDTINGFICSPKKNNFYVNSVYTTNLFVNDLTIGSTKINIVNTPYFHNQLFTDFNSEGVYGKYKGSAYLLLNSLPFNDLFNSKDNIFYSSIFKEIGATHFIPYHLILKWGSIYHRYKNYLLNGVDILQGSLNNNFQTQPVNISEFFDNNTNDTFSIDYGGNTYDISYSYENNMGIHPFYDAIFHQIINGYDHYNVSEGSSSFEANVSAGGIIEVVQQNGNNLNYFTQYVDNSKYDSTDLRYTLLPSCALNNTLNKDQFLKNNEDYFRVIWSDLDSSYINDTLSGQTFPSPYDYNYSLIDGYSLSKNYLKIIDLMGTFSPNILSEFETMFLDFASDIGATTNIETPNPKFYNTKYVHFQNLLRDMFSVTGLTKSSNGITFVNSLKDAQIQNLEKITTVILDDHNLVKLTMANPKELDAHVLNGFAQTSSTNTLSWNPFDLSQETQTNLNLIDLYLGQDIDNSYRDFFILNNIELNETNILLFRPLILIFAGFLNNPNFQGMTFPDYVKNYIIQSKSPNNPNLTPDGFNNRFIQFITTLSKNFAGLTLPPSDNQQDSTNISGGYNNTPIKIDLYNHFKSFNDKWVAGNSIGQRSLIEEFLFLDRRNKDIGDEYFLDIQKLIPIIDERNKDINLYEAISLLIENSGLDMRPLPAYINFYGTNYNNKTRTTASSKTAGDLFGTFLEVDYQDASPKIVIQFVGDNSKHLDNGSSNNTFNDDSFNCSMVNNNPLLLTTANVVSLGDLTKSNKAVSFEVSFGEQNQGIFKSIQLDQTSIRNTAASVYVLEALASSETGANAASMDVSLFDYYKTAAYSCEVTMLGNVMIQPTMFFYLKNVPMFRGSYWITEVNHSIRNNQVVTTFKGARVPIGGFPDPKDSFASSYKTLFDRLTANAIKLVQLESTINPVTDIIVHDSNIGFVVTEPGILQKWETPNTLITSYAGRTAYGVPFNGWGQGTDGKFVQLVNYNGTTWLRANVKRMVEADYGTRNMMMLNSLPNNSFGIVDWNSVSGLTTTKSFFTLNYEFFASNGKGQIRNEIYYPNRNNQPQGGIKCTFFNPANNKKVPLTTTFSFTTVNNVKVINQIEGPIDTFVPTGYGISMSSKLMSDLGLSDGDIVYFDVDNNDIINGIENLASPSTLNGY